MLKLANKKHGRKAFGVISGLGEWVGWDDNFIEFVRTIFILFGIFGAGIVVYVVLAILIFVFCGQESEES